MAVLLVLSIAGIFHRAWHLHSSKHKSVFYRENSTTTAANLFLLNGQYNSVQPIDSKNAERCICTILTIKWCKAVTECKLRQWAVLQVQPIAVFIGRALYLPRSDNKIGAKCEHSAVGELPERWLIFDDPSLLHLGNISRSASTPKAEIENS